MVSFYSNNVHIRLRDRKKLKIFLGGIFKRYRKKLSSLTYVFCDDEYLLQINRDFLKHDFYTDIITFNLSEAGNPIVGEIYISVDRVRENAKLNETSITNEIHRVIFHGALHLCGLNDKTKTDQNKMTIEENKCLSLYLS